MKTYSVYLLMSSSNKVIYVEITSDLIKRVYQHKNKQVEGFTKKYNVNKLVYYEQFNDPTAAITREKQIKGGSRQKKLDLASKENPDFEDLYGILL